MRRLACLLLVVGTVSACRYGTSAETFPPAQGPEGVTVRVETDSSGLRGELIEVRGDGIVLRVGGQVWLLGYSLIQSSRFEQYDDEFGMGDGKVPPQEARDRMRLLARFPQGLDAQKLDDLLGLYGQTRFRTPNSP
jgi:hypothetical protein